MNSQHQAIPPRLERDGGRLFDLAMWCLGQDVRHPDGNLLLRHGFQREERPAGSQGTSAYSLGLSPAWGPLVGQTVTLTLWGFGALLHLDQDPAAVLLERDLWRPWLVDLRKAHWPAFQLADLGEKRRPIEGEEVHRVRWATSALASWLASYEAWVPGQVGTDYRPNLLADRRARPPCPAAELPERWRQLAIDVEHLVKPPLPPTPSSIH